MDDVPPRSGWPQPPMRPGAPARRRALGLALAGLLGTPARRATATPWPARIEPGTVLLLRHALTEPGLGDPPGFRLEACATQRNLSEAGRAQARRAGERLRAAGVPIVDVLSSRWCRCLETARLAFGHATPWPMLDSFFEDPSSRATRTAALRARIEAHATAGLLVMVTHQVNITAATGLVPAMGEAFAVRAGAGGELRVVGRHRYD